MSSHGFVRWYICFSSFALLLSIEGSVFFFHVNVMSSYVFGDDALIC